MTRAARDIMHHCFGWWIMPLIGPQEVCATNATGKNNDQRGWNIGSTSVFFRVRLLGCTVGTFLIQNLPLCRGLVLRTIGFLVVLEPMAKSVSLCLESCFQVARPAAKQSHSCSRNLKAALSKRVVVARSCGSNCVVPSRASQCSLSQSGPAGGSYTIICWRIDGSGTVPVPSSIDKNRWLRRDVNSKSTAEQFSAIFDTERNECNCLHPMVAY